MLDLDETLIKCCMDEEDVDKVVYAKNPDGQPLKVMIISIFTAVLTRRILDPL